MQITIDSKANLNLKNPCFLCYRKAIFRYLFTQEISASNFIAAQKVYLDRFFS